MPVITVTFACGHAISCTGAEDKLTCPCGNTTVRSIAAPAPVFRGHVEGPCAVPDFDLPAKAVTFKGTDRA